MRFFFSLFILTINSAVAQDGVCQEDLADYYFECANTTYAYDQCLAYALEAEWRLKDCEMWEKYIRVLNYKTYSYKGLGLLEAYKQQVSFNMQEAPKYVSPDSRPYVVTNFNYANYFTDVQGNYKQGIEIYEQLLADFTTDNLGFKATVCNNLGDLYQRQGDFHRSISYLKQAKRLYLSHKKVKPIETYKMSSNLAEAYLSLKDYRKAINLFLTAKAHLEETTEGKHFKFNVKRNIAAAYFEIGNMDSCFYYLRSAEKEKGKSDLQKAKLHLLKATVYSGQKQYIDAILPSQKALQFLPLENRIHRAETQLFLAKNYLMSQQLPFALQANQKGIEAIIDDSVSDPLLLNLRVQRGDILLQKQKAKADKAQLIAALTQYSQAFKIRHDIQQQLFNERSKLFLNNHNDFLENALKTAWQLYKLTQNPSYIDTAFQFVEQSKANILLEEIKRKEAAGFSNLPDSLIQKRYDLLNEINFIEKIIKKSKNPINKLEQERIDKNETLQSLDRSLQKSYPLFSKLTSEMSPISLKKQQENLDQHSALVEYFLTDSLLFVIYIDKKSAQFLQIPLQESLDQQIDFLRDNHKLGGGNRQLTKYRQNAYALYQTLLGRLTIPSEISRLIIIPDKKIAVLPFDMLLTEATKAKSTKALSFLLYRYTISYAFSANILESVKKKTPLKVNNWLGIAPHFEGKKSLKSNQKETKRIQQLLGGTLLLGARASSQNFVTFAPAADIIHLSSHANEGSKNNNPSIEFSNDSLFLQDLYSLRLKAQMVVLSACKTNLGEQDKSEGILSLSRGFTYAGAPSLIGTLGKVNEASTQKIIQGFYQHLLAGAPKDEALRQAKLDYLDNTGNLFAAPYHWAGLVVVGDTEGLVFSQGAASCWWLAVGGIVLLILGVVRYRFCH